jgi:hypothetical protein
MKRARTRKARGGYTLLELTISTVLLASLGYSVSLGVKMGQESNATVNRISSESRATRKSISSLADDVRGCSNSRITVTTDVAGNSRVQLMQPIVVASALVWGVYDRRLGRDEDTWNRQDWTVVYTVDGQNRLVRRIVDLDGVTQIEDVLADGVRAGNLANPGFRVAQSGDVWEVNIAKSHGVNDEGTSASGFHVRTRN